MARKLSDPRERFAVVLVRPESLENIGLAARAMKNTGFQELRVVGRSKVEIACPRTAVHAKDILKEASFYSDLPSATADLNIVFASTAKPRQNFSALPLDEAVSQMFSFPPETRIGLLFGNERTGLTSAELLASNYRWTIPQASRQPSYNLAAAVLITLFEMFRRLITEPVPSFPARYPLTAGARRKKAGLSSIFEGAATGAVPLPRRKQEECIRRIIQKLEEREFIHSANKRHTTQMLFDLLGRLAMTDRDRRLLLAIFSHSGPDR